MPEYEQVKAEMLSILEVVEKYPDSLQPRVFEILVQKYLGAEAVVTAIMAETPLQTVMPPSSAAATEIGAVPAFANAEKPKDRKKTPTKESFSLVKDLDLRGKEGQIPSFKEFYEQKKPKNHAETVTVAVYYLKKYLQVAAVTPDHIYTCYKATSARLPKALRQAIRDASGKRYGYIDAKNMNDIRLPTSGEALVEHDLPDKSEEETS